MVFDIKIVKHVLKLRKKYKDLVLEKHGIKMGFMGAFLKASADALQELPAVNGRIEGIKTPSQQEKTLFILIMLMYL